MPIVSYRKKVWKRRKRRLVPHQRIFKIKSLTPRRRVYIHKGKLTLFKIRPQRTRLFRRFNLYVTPKYQKSFQHQYIPKKKPAVSKEAWKAKKKDWGKVWQTSGYKELYKPKTKTAFQEPLKDWMKEWYKREKLKTPKKAPKAAKRVERRGGKREYEWKGKWYGIMKSLGPTLIFEVFPTHKYYMYIRARKNYGDHMAVIKAIRKAMQNTIDNLTSYAIIIINKYVPKDSGDLRKAMIDSIKNSKVKGMTIKVELDTGNLKYANPVNNMPESKIRHNMKTKQISRKTGKFLHDPKAIEGWFQMIQLNLNKEAGKLLNVLVADIVKAFTFRYYKGGKPTLKRKTYETRKVGTVIGKRGDILSSRVAGPRKPREEFRKIYGAFTETERDKADMSKHMRKNKWRIELEKATKEKSTLVEYPRNLIMKMFKIRGLYKGNRVY